ncbi:MAG: hypothetical protein EBU90_10305 [Proteobacteria bacterium]|nr:hypothetical protein [Pseudomonadota bacterium]NBP13801.1 hypothetical protein [bacterium]
MTYLAVCIVGRVKGYENNKDSIERFCKLLIDQNYKVHFFVSLNAERDTYHKDFEIYLSKLIPDINHKFFYRIYTKELEGPDFDSKYNMCSMYWNQQNCSDMIRNSGIAFSKVMKWRTEICFTNAFSLHILQPNTVYIPNDFDYGGVNDQMMCSDLETAHKYLGVYNCLRTYQKESVYIHPETLLKHHLQKSGVTIVRFHFPYHLKR